MGRADMSVWTWLFGTRPSSDPNADTVDDIALLKTGAIVGALGLGAYYIKKKIDSMFKED